MTSECLPEVIRDSLQIIIETNKFSSDACEIICEKIAGNEISSSWRINISECERANLDDSGRRLCLFCKYLDRSSNNYFRPEGLVYFKNELVFYGEILKQFENISTLRKEVNPKTETHLTFAPKCFRVSNIQDECPFIIMEDLLSEGYAPLDIKQQHSLSVECARAILRQLGRFHAYSFAMKDQRPQAFADATSKLCETVFRRDTRGTLGKVFIHAIHDAFKLAKQSLPSKSVYVEKFAAFTLDIFDRMATLVEGDNDDVEYKVVTHGDLWPNNILCKFNKENPTTIDFVTFIDYQGSRFSSPVHDLMFVLLVALDKPQRDEHREQLIRHYHRSLCETIQKLGSDPLRLFPYSALQNQLLKHTQFALALALVGLPLFYNETGGGCNSTTIPKPKEDNETDLETLLEFVHEVQTNKTMKCKNKMLEIIMDVVDQGYL